MGQQLLNSISFSTQSTLGCFFRLPTHSFCAILALCYSLIIKAHFAQPSSPLRFTQLYYCIIAICYLYSEHHQFPSSCHQFPLSSHWWTILPPKLKELGNPKQHNTFKISTISLLETTLVAATDLDDLWPGSVRPVSVFLLHHYHTRSCPAINKRCHLREGESVTAMVIKLCYFLIYHFVLATSLQGYLLYI